uniref:Ecbeacfb-23b4-4637-bf19-17b1f7386b0f-CDS n=1 Tax=Plasmodiophora brassicae TaxID=37360 RepID=A0A3P3YWC7_PLABS|nr:ecbeacfb-23b4-4637-bf19-17b1f7386b0f-CDS [Plasmodiophora brassicae]
MPECMKSSRAPPPLGTAYILEKVMQIKNVTSATDLSDVPILARKFMELPPSPGQQMPECMKSSRAPPPLGTAYILEKVMQIKNVTSATDLSDVPILARKFMELPPSPGQQMPECMKSSRAPPPLGTAYILEKVMQIKNVTSATDLSDVPILARKFMELPPSPGQQMPECMKSSRAPPPLGTAYILEKVMQIKNVTSATDLSDVPILARKFMELPPSPGQQMPECMKSSRAPPPLGTAYILEKVMQIKNVTSATDLSDVPILARKFMELPPSPGQQMPECMKSSRAPPPLGTAYILEKVMQIKNVTSATDLSDVPILARKFMELPPSPGQQMPECMKSSRAPPPLGTAYILEKVMQIKNVTSATDLSDVPILARKFMELPPSPGQQMPECMKSSRAPPPLGTAYILEKVMQIKNVTSATDLSDVPILARKFMELPPSPGQQMPECMKSSRAPPPLGTAYILEKVMQIKNVTSATDLSDVPILARKFMELPPSPGQQMPECMKSSRAPPPLGTAYILEKVMQIKNVTSATDLSDVPILARKFMELPPSPGQQMPECMKSSRAPPPLGTAYILEKVMQIKNVTSATDLSDVPILARKFMELPPSPGQQMPECMKSSRAPPPLGTAYILEKVMQIKNVTSATDLSDVPILARKFMELPPSPGQQMPECMKSSRAPPPLGTAYILEKVMQIKNVTSATDLSDVPILARKFMELPPSPVQQMPECMKSSRAPPPPSARHIYSKKLCKSKMWQVLQIFQTCPFWRENLYVN